MHCKSTYVSASASTPHVDPQNKTKLRRRQWSNSNYVTLSLLVWVCRQSWWVNECMTETKLWFVPTPPLVSFNNVCLDFSHTHVIQALFQSHRRLLLPLGMFFGQGEVWSFFPTLLLQHRFKPAQRLEPAFAHRKLASASMCNQHFSLKGLSKLKKV